MDAESKVQLARMEGKIDLVNERHEGMKADIIDVRTRLHSHSNKISVLEAKEHQRTGAVGTVKVLWGVGGFSIMGVAAIVLRKLGV